MEDLLLLLMHCPALSGTLHVSDKRPPLLRRLRLSDRVRRRDAVLTRFTADLGRDVRPFPPVDLVARHVDPPARVRRGLPGVDARLDGFPRRRRPPPCRPERMSRPPPRDGTPARDEEGWRAPSPQPQRPTLRRFQVPWPRVPVLVPPGPEGRCLSAPGEGRPGRVPPGTTAPAAVLVRTRPVLAVLLRGGCWPGRGRGRPRPVGPRPEPHRGSGAWGGPRVERESKGIKECCSAQNMYQDGPLK